MLVIPKIVKRFGLNADSIARILDDLPEGEVATLLEQFENQHIPCLCQDLTRMMSQLHLDSVKRRKQNLAERRSHEE